jgi:hypothetical protein
MGQPADCLFLALMTNPDWLGDAFVAGEAQFCLMCITAFAADNREESNPQWYVYEYMKMSVVSVCFE